MTVTARLSRAIHETFGEEPADDLVNWMGQMEANRSELREVFDLYQARSDAKFDAFLTRMDAGFAESDARMDARFAERDARMDARIAERDSRVDARFNAADARMDAGFSRLELLITKVEGKLDAKIESKAADLIKWSFVFWVGAVTSIAVLARVLR